MKTLNRRQFLGSTTALAVFPATFFLAGQSNAGGHNKVDPNDPQAKALSYVHESPNANTVCANCQLYTGAANTAWGPCAIFPGKEVAADGWCSAWVKKAG